jgi:glycine oxidase
MQNQKRVDCIIIGLGLSGAAVALQLIRAGKKIAVFDVPGNNHSSRVAAGLFNPIAGKLMVKTWRADDLFPYLVDFYRDAERLTSQRFLHEKPIYIPFRSVEEQNSWTSQSGDAGIKDYVERVFTSNAFGGQVHDDLGGIRLRRCGYIHVNAYLDSVKKLIGDSFHETEMHHDKIVISKDGVSYGDVRADSIVLCEGLHALHNPLTNWLPLRALKGETLDVRFAEEPGAIFNRGVYAVSFGGGVYKVGATFERNATPGISNHGKEELENRLRALVKIPYEVTAQNWGFRPTVPDRRPIIGRHPEYENVYVFNGMGTKAVSQAPYFSKLLTEALIHGSQIAQEVNISRFYALSSKSRD